MTDTFYRTGIHSIDHTTFGGLIYPSDFNTDYKGKNNTNGSTIANRIVSDQKKDKQWRENKEERRRKYAK